MLAREHSIAATWSIPREVVAHFHIRPIVMGFCAPMLSRLPANLKNRQNTGQPRAHTAVQSSKKGFPRHNGVFPLPTRMPTLQNAASSKKKSVKKKQTIMSRMPHTTPDPKCSTSPSSPQVAPNRPTDRPSQPPADAINPRLSMPKTMP